MPKQRSINAGKGTDPSRLERARVALRRRDWLGIAIEIGIVTLGVLLAFRVEQWGQQRNKAIEERQFLERLYRENDRSIRELRAIHTDHRRKVEQLAMALRARSDRAMLQKFSSEEGFGCWMMQIPAATYSDTAARELIGSGRLSLITDPELRAKVRALATAQSESTARVAYSREVTQLFAPSLNQYLILALDEAPEPRCHVDWPGIMDRQETINATIRTYRAHLLAQQNRQALLAEAEDVQAALACALEKLKCRR